MTGLAAGGSASADRGSVRDLVASRLREIPDYPVPGVTFRDFTPLLADGAALATVVAEIAERFAGRVDVVAGIEARGFMIGTAAAVGLGVGFVPIRKAGKLPAPCVSASYDLEYGSATIEMHRDAFPPGTRVLLIDDVLATGGTALAACRLVDEVGGLVVAVDVVVEIAGLGGRERLAGRTVESLLVV